jgi:hypothetical protein
MITKMRPHDVMVMVLDNNGYGVSKGSRWRRRMTKMRPRDEAKSRPREPETCQ